MLFFYFLTKNDVLVFVDSLFLDKYDVNYHVDVNVNDYLTFFLLFALHAESSARTYDARDVMEGWHTDQ